MLFPRRTWALRITERMGLPARSQETTWSADLVIWAAKQDAAMMEVAIGRRLGKPDRILLATVSMTHNTSAALKLARELQMTEVAARELLAQFKQAARDLAKEQGFTKIVEIADRPAGARA